MYVIKLMDTVVTASRAKSFFRNVSDHWYVLHGFEKRILPDINKRSSLGERWGQAEA